jgi:hypothetical protein
VRLDQEQGKDESVDFHVGFGRRKKSIFVLFSLQPKCRFTGGVVIRKLMASVVQTTITNGVIKHTIQLSILGKTPRVRFTNTVRFLILEAIFSILNECIIC